MLDRDFSSIEKTIMLALVRNTIKYSEIDWTHTINKEKILDTIMAWNFWLEKCKEGTLVGFKSISGMSRTQTRGVDRKDYKKIIIENIKK